MPEAPHVSVVIHDVAPATWPACRRLIAAIEEVRPVPLTLLLVPHYGGHDSADDADFMQAMRQRHAGGDELALHGYTHVDLAPVKGPIDWAKRRLYTREGEFATLSATQAEQRINAGHSWFNQHRLPLQGFIAPAWLMSEGTRIALRRQSSLLYTSSLQRLYLLPEFTAVPAPSLVYSSRAAWRRGASRLWNPLAMKLNAGAELIRLGLHPIDAEHPAIQDSWQGLLAQLLKTRTPVTKAQYIETLQAKRNAACAA